MQKRSIAEEVLGITDPNQYAESLAIANYVLAREPFDPDWLAEKRTMPIKELSQNDYEKAAVGKSLVAIFSGQKVTGANTLTDWPVYTAMMHNHGKRAEHPATALMIGSLSALSSRSFTCLAETEYGANRTIIVDPVAGDLKLLHGDFIYGSGLNLPLRDESIDFVHTNRLFHMLVDHPGKEKARRRDILRVISEIGRVLKPGGQLFMVETIPHLKTDVPRVYAQQLASFGSFMHSSLVAANVGYVAEDLRPRMPAGKAFLFDRDRNFSAYSQQVEEGLIAVYAQK